MIQQPHAIDLAQKIARHLERGPVGADRREDEPPRRICDGRRPFYSNSDEQTMLNDCLISAIIRRPTFDGAIAHYEARNRHNPSGAFEWPNSTYYRRYQRALSEASSRLQRASIPQSHRRALVGREAIAIAPPRIFGHLPFSNNTAVVHYAGARGADKRNAMTADGADFTCAACEGAPTLKKKSTLAPQRRRSILAATAAHA